MFTLRVGRLRNVEVLPGWIAYSSCPSRKMATGSVVWLKRAEIGIHLGVLGAAVGWTVAVAPGRHRRRDQSQRHHPCLAHVHSLPPFRMPGPEQAL